MYSCHPAIWYWEVFMFLAPVVVQTATCLWKCTMSHCTPLQFHLLIRLSFLITLIAEEFILKFKYFRKPSFWILHHSVNLKFIDAQKRPLFRNVIYRRSWRWIQKISPKQWQAPTLHTAKTQCSFFLVRKPKHNGSQKTSKCTLQDWALRSYKLGKWMGNKAIELRPKYAFSQYHGQSNVAVILHIRVRVLSIYLGQDLQIVSSKELPRKKF
jgi:hypothetical protein